MRIHTIIVYHKGNMYSFDIEKDVNGELYLVSPITGELLIVEGIPLREKYQVIALRHLTQMNM